MRFQSLYTLLLLAASASLGDAGPVTTTTTGLTTLTLTRTARTTTTKGSPIITLTKPSTLTLSKTSTKIRTSSVTSVLTKVSTSTRVSTVGTTLTLLSPVVTLTQPSTTTKQLISTATSTQTARITATSRATSTLQLTSTFTQPPATVYLQGTVTVQAATVTETVTETVTSCASTPTGSSSSSPLPTGALQQGTYTSANGCGANLVDINYLNFHQYGWFSGVTLEQCRAMVAQDPNISKYTKMLIAYPSRSGCFAVDSFDVSGGQQLASDEFLPVYDLSCYPLQSDPNPTPDPIPAGALQAGTYTSTSGCGSDLVDINFLNFHQYGWFSGVTLEECRNLLTQDANIYKYAKMMIAYPSKSGCFVVDSFDVNAGQQSASDEFLPVYDLNCFPSTSVPGDSLAQGTYTSTTSCGKSLVDWYHAQLNGQVSVYTSLTVEECKAVVQDGNHNWATMMLYDEQDKYCYLVDKFDIDSGTQQPSDAFYSLYDLNCITAASTGPPAFAAATVLPAGSYSSTGSCGTRLVDLWHADFGNQLEYKPFTTLEECMAIAHDDDHQWATAVIPFAYASSCYIAGPFTVAGDMHVWDSYLPVYDLSCSV